MKLLGFSKFSILFISAPLPAGNDLILALGKVEVLRKIYKYV